jgi:predicted kinase
MKELYLLRGLPGAGKSTLAKSIGGIHMEADKYFMEGDEYKFDAFKLKEAHEWCQNAVNVWMRSDLPKVIVSNTFTMEWEMQPYYDLAQKYGYRVYSLIVENRHEGINSHRVPEEKLVQMKKRFEIKL